MTKIKRSNFNILINFNYVIAKKKLEINELSCISYWFAEVKDLY